MKKEKLPAHQKYSELIRKFSVDAVERIDKELYPVFEDLVDHLVTDIYGFSYKRPHIDIKVRHLISLGVLAAMGGCKPQLNFQLEAALNLGIPPHEVKEVFIQVAVFAGNARAINAANIFHKILMQRNRDGKNTR
jgi:4-carboxymuconolactone decarboxylase